MQCISCNRREVGPSEGSGPHPWDKICGECQREEMDAREASDNRNHPTPHFESLMALPLGAPVWRAHVRAKGVVKRYDEE